MSLESYDRKKEDFQYHVDDIFLEILESYSVSYDHVDDEETWDNFLKPILEEMRVSDEQVVTVNDFSFSVNLENGTLVVKLKKFNLTKEYNVSTKALEKYEDEIKPRVLEQERLDEEAIKEEKKRLTKLKRIAEENPRGRNSKEMYKEITRETIRGDFSAEIVDGNLRLVFYGPDFGIDDIKEYSLFGIE